MKQDGKLNLVVFIASGDRLKEVMLEPPSPVGKGANRHWPCSRVTRQNRTRNFIWEMAPLRHERPFDTQHKMMRIAIPRRLYVALWERLISGWRTNRLAAQRRSVTMTSPKADPTDNAKKDPDEWLSGDDPMTGAQASYLKILCEQAGIPDAFNDNLTKSQASKMIDEMREKANV